MMFDAKRIKDECVLWIQKFFEENGPGCNAVIGISGGKDSLTLLYALHSLKRFYPKTFDIHAVTVDLGFQNVNLDKIKAICEDLNVEYTIVKTDIAKIIFDDRKETNPCSLCAKMRKGALNKAIKKIKHPTRIKMFNGYY